MERINDDIFGGINKDESHNEDKKANKKLKKARKKAKAAVKKAKKAEKELKSAKRKLGKQGREIQRLNDESRHETERRHETEMMLAYIRGRFDHRMQNLQLPNLSGGDLD